ncbi:hypothetical protein V8F06_013331 [Rhypophila decipiens]
MCNPKKLAPGIFWNQLATAFERCACGSRGNNKGKASADTFLRASALLRRPCDRVRVLLPSRPSIIPHSGTTSALGPMDPGSAVIFGRSELFPWRWPDLGDPKMEDASEFGTGGSDRSSAESTSASASAPASASASTKIPSMSGESRGGTTVTALTAVSSPPSSQGGISVPSREGDETGTARFGRRIRKLWKPLKSPKRRGPAA